MVKSQYINRNVHVCRFYIHTQQGGTQQSVLLSMQEVHGRLLDILALLLSRGVDPLVKDVDGNTPSDKASVITTREECFLDGAILLGTYICMCSIYISTLCTVLDL